MYRSDDLHTLSPKDVTILENMRIDTIIDYRNNREIAKRPNVHVKNTVTYIFSPEDKITELASSDMKNDKDKIDALLELDLKGKLNLDDDLLKKSILSFVTGEQPRAIYRKVLKIYSDPMTDIILQHCRGGKDRTRYGTALVLLSLGVSEDDVIMDYMLTSEANRERNRKRMNEYEQYTSNKNVLRYLSNAMDTNHNVIESAIKEMKKIGGSINGYMINILKLSETDLISIRQKYLI